MVMSRYIYYRRRLSTKGSKHGRRIVSRQNTRDLLYLKTTKRVKQQQALRMREDYLYGGKCQRQKIWQGYSLQIEYQRLIVSQNYSASSATIGTKEGGLLIWRLQVDKVIKGHSIFSGTLDVYTRVRRSQVGQLRG